MSDDDRVKRARVPETPSIASAAALSSGRPRYRPESLTFVSKSKVVTIHRSVEKINVVDINGMFQQLVQAIDTVRGGVFQSAYEFPGRYSRWSVGFKNPPLVLESRGKSFWIEALNKRGKVMLPAIRKYLHKNCTSITLGQEQNDCKILGQVNEVSGHFSEEERSKQNSIFSVVRSISAMFETDPEVDPQLGLYGAFGYDLTFQFEHIKLKFPRKEDDGERDLVLYLPDEILVHDVQAARAWLLKYDFEFGAELGKTAGACGEPFAIRHNNSVPKQVNAPKRDHKPGEYAKSVERAKEEFKCGNLFECVLSQTFQEPFEHPPSTLYYRFLEINPSPYLFVLNLGSQEHIVGASPEMFVRVERTPRGNRVETCPISGTIRRGRDALQDADHILEILDSAKEKSELTMCTDVDRNDKSRICKPGSVQVVGRRQIEKYSRLIHTVDHVEGYLRDGFDALDAFLVHTWAVTVSGAPKTWAMQFIEDHERSPRGWYGGAVGILGFDGHLNTGLTIRTVRIRNGTAEIRAGATLLWDSIPMEEEQETELKASAFLEAIRGVSNPESDKRDEDVESLEFCHKAGVGKKVLLVDHQDSFVHTLANYLRQTGALVRTVRYNLLESHLDEFHPDFVLLSPGPGKPDDFNCSKNMDLLVRRQIPAFGVCLGLQCMVEYFGGSLSVLDYPMHGKPSILLCREFQGDRSFEGLPSEMSVARYHSLYAAKLPSSLVPTAVCTAKGDEGGEEIVMAIRHTELPYAAVQFHPESILTSPDHGLRLLANAMSYLTY